MTELKYQERIIKALRVLHSLSPQQRLRVSDSQLKSSKRVCLNLQTKTEHPYIEINSKICNGSPVVAGTRVRIVDIAIEYEYLNHSPDEIINAHPHLKLEQVHDALSYYYENRKDLDNKIREDKQFIQKISEAQKIR